MPGSQSKHNMTRDRGCMPLASERGRDVWAQIHSRIHCSFVYKDPVSFEVAKHFRQKITERVQEGGTFVKNEINLCSRF